MLKKYDRVLVRDKNGRGHPWIERYFLGFNKYNKIIVASSICPSDVYNNEKGCIYNYFKEISKLIEE